MILTVAPGCDNVAWGGVDVRWVQPVAAVAEGPQPDTPVEESALAEVAMPLLLAGVIEAGRVSLVVVGEIRDGALVAATETSVTQGAVVGSDWILFNEGVRVGSVSADDVGAAGDFCPSVTVSGVVELVQAASGVERFLALPETRASEAPYGPVQALASDFDQRVASLTMAQEAIRRVGAQWPADGVLPTRQDIQSIQPLGTPEPSVIATYLYRDQLQVGAPAQGAYSVFVLTSPSGNQYRAAYEWYQAADSPGKWAPRYFNHMDWDGDGRGEILVEVFGSNARWHAALDQGGGGWVRTFESPCGAGASQAR